MSECVCAVFIFICCACWRNRWWPFFVLLSLEDLFRAFFDSISSNHILFLSNRFMKSIPKIAIVFQPSALHHNDISSSRQNYPLKMSFVKCIGYVLTIEIHGYERSVEIESILSIDDVMHDTYKSAKLPLSFSTIHEYCSLWRACRWAQYDFIVCVFVCHCFCCWTSLTWKSTNLYKAMCMVTSNLYICGHNKKSVSWKWMTALRTSVFPCPLVSLNEGANVAYTFNEHFED